MAVSNVYVNTINSFGNDKQKEEFLRPFTNGKNIGSFSLSEPGRYIGEENLCIISLMINDNIYLNHRLSNLRSGK